MAKDKEPQSGALKVDASTVLKHKRRFVDTKSKLDDLAEMRKSDLAAAENDGIDKAAFKLAMKMNLMDPDKARSFFRLTGGYYEAINPGVLGQRDLFATVVPAHPEERTAADLLEIEAAGKTVGRKGERPQTDHHHEPGSEEAQAFERGWRAGSEASFTAGDAASTSTGTTVTAPRGRRSGLKDDTDAARKDLAETAKDRHGFDVVSPPVPKGVKSDLKPKGPKAVPASKKDGPKKAAPAGKPKGDTKAKAPKPSEPEAVAPDDEPTAPAGGADVEPDPVPVDASAFDMSAHLPH